MKRTARLALLLLLSLVGARLPADDRSPASPAERPDAMSAVERGVTLLEKSARSYPTHRKCFACHHQTLPLLAIVEARRAGARTDDELPAALIEHTTRSFRASIENLNAGEGLGGKGLTVGYGLWTLRLGGVKSDDLTDAMATYLIKTQEEDGHWDLHAIRPPAEESLVLCTVLAAAGLKEYARDARRNAADKAIERATGWLQNATLDLNEDRVARLWGARLLETGDADLAAARKKVVDSQRPDGGWAPTSELESDAYATGSALFMLLDTGLAPAEPSAQRAVEFLVKTQLDDGSWHVRKRAKPVQVFFDNGDPHGEDQFISISATAWSVAALARAAAGSARSAR